MTFHTKLFVLLCTLAHPRGGVHGGSPVGP